MVNYNGLVQELDRVYFPDVKYYRDNKTTEKIHYNCELFNNGCLTIGVLYKRLCKLTKDTEKNIINLCEKFIQLN